MLNQISVKIIDKRIGKQFPSLRYATPGSAGIDLMACIDAPLAIKPGQRCLISSGIAVHINHSGYAGVLMPRSGLGHKKGIILGNGVGLIDSDYQGEVMISCWNSAHETYCIEPGERIAQIVFMPVSQPTLSFVTAFEESERGEKGFGSTGRFVVEEAETEEVA